MILRNKNVLIFGGGSGIGKAIAIRFIEAGAKVMIAGRTEEKLKLVAEEISSPNIFYRAFDVTDITCHNALFSECAQVMDGLNAFVNAAALGTDQCTGRGFEPWDITPKEWDTLTDINFKAAFFLIRNEVDYMVEKNIHGNILNIASNAAYMDIVGSYGASKDAIIKWTRSFGKKYGHKGIIMNGIAPGATFTPMIARYAHDVDQEYSRHAIERFIRPDEIAELAFYLMSNYGEIICGHTVVADGGDSEAI